MQEHPDEESGPDEIRAKFAPVAAATDAPPPGEGERHPLVNRAQPISTLARTVGQLLHKAPIFFFNKSLVTVDESGEVEPMGPERFTSWVETYLAFTSPGRDGPSVDSIGKDMAAKIMAADQFKAGIRELKAVSGVRLPVWTDDGTARTVRLAPVGYDAESCLYTVDGVPYPHDQDEKTAHSFVWEVLRQFPYDPEGEPHVGERRSFSAQVASMIGVYCHQLFPEGTPRPLVIYNANQSGSGKSLSMRITLAPVHGAPAESGKPETEKEFESLLDAAAMARKPYLILDDCKSIHSNALNRFITSPVHENRVYYSQRLTCSTKTTQVFASGNGLNITEDLERRSLIVDFFEPGEIAGRKFDREITPSWLFSKETRARFLAALWAMVRKWRDAGMPLLSEHRRASFEEWTGIIGGIVTANEIRNPFVPRAVSSGGDEATRALILVIARLVGDCATEEPPVLTTSDILEAAEAGEFLELIVGGAKDARKALGWRLKRLRGRQLLDTQNRAFEFGRRELTEGAKYAVRFL